MSKKEGIVSVLGKRGREEDKTYKDSTTIRRRVDVVGLTEMGDGMGTISRYRRLNNPETPRTERGSKLREKKEKEELPIKKEILDDYRNFITDELTTLITRWQDNPGEVERQLEDPELDPYKVLFQNYTQTKAGSEAADSPVRIIKTEDFNEFINSESGLAQIHQIRRWACRQMAYHSGVIIKSNDPDTGVGPLENKSVRLNKRKLLRNFRDWWSQPGSPVTGGEFDYLDTKGKLYAYLAGTAIPTGGLTYLAYRLSLAQRMNIKTTQGALELARTGSVPKNEFIREQFGAVDVRNFSKFKLDKHGNPVLDIGNNPIPVSRSEKPRMLNNEISWPVPTPRNVQSILLSEAIQLRKFEEHVMGVPVGRFSDVMNYSPTNEIDTKVIKKYKQDDDNVDANGERCQIYNNATGEWESNVLYRYDTINYKKNPDLFIRHKQLLQKISSEVVADSMRKDIRRRLEMKTDRLGKALDLVTKRTGKAVVEEEKERISREQKKLMELKASLTPVYTSFESVDEELANIEKRKMDKTKAEAAAVEILPHGGAAPRTGIDVLNDVMGRHGVPDNFEISITRATGEVTIRNIGARRQRVHEDHADAMGALVGGQTYYKEVEALEKTRDEKLAEIKKDEVIVAEAIKAITGAQEDIDKSYEKLNDEKLTDKDSSIKVTEEMKNAFTDIRNCDAFIGIDLGEDDLRDQPYDELMNRIVEANREFIARRAAHVGPNPPPIRGWSAEDKDKPANRKRLLYAIAEAKARDRDLYGRNPGQDFEDLTNIYNIKEVKLLTLAQSELISLIQEKEDLYTYLRDNIHFGRVDPFGPVDSDRMYIVRGIARRRLKARMASLENEIKIWDNQNTELEDEKGNITVEKIVPPEIFAIGSAVRRYDEIGKEMSSMSKNDLLKFLSTDVITADNKEFSPVEQQGGDQMIAKVRLMQLLFDHRNRDEKDQDAAYRRNCAFMNDDEWRDKLVGHFGLELPVVPGPDGEDMNTFRSAITMLSEAVRQDEISGVQISEFLQQNLIMSHMVSKLENMV